MPLEGEMPIPLDLACIGLGAAPKASLLPGTVDPSRASSGGGEGLPMPLLF